MMELHMLNSVVIALVVAVLPLAVAFFKSPGALMFLMLLVGDVVERQFGELMRSVVSSLAPTSKFPVNELTSVTLFLLPMILALFLLRKTTPVKSYMFQVLAAAAAGVVLLYGVHRLGSRSMQEFIEASSLWPPVKSYYGIAVVAGLVLCFGAFFMSRQHEEGHKRFGKKHKG
jgi:hypothetical protein